MRGICLDENRIDQDEGDTQEKCTEKPTNAKVFDPGTIVSAEECLL